MYGKKINSKCSLILSDLHCPYQNDKVIKQVIKYSKLNYKIDTVILLGDIIDFISISDFDKRPVDALIIQQEIESTIKMLNFIRKEFPKQRIIYTIGNHERRLERMKMRKMELFGLEDLKLENLLKLKNNRIELLKDKQILNINGINLLHGDEIPRRKLNKPSANCIYGHFHKTKIDFSDNTIDGIKYESHGLGALCDMYPDYMPHNDWNLGFGIIYNTEIHNYRIKNGRIIR